MLYICMYILVNESIDIILLQFKCVFLAQIAHNNIESAAYMYVHVIVY